MLFDLVQASFAFFGSNHIQFCKSIGRFGGVEEDPPGFTDVGIWGIAEGDGRGWETGKGWIVAGLSRTGRAFVQLARARAEAA